MSLETIFYIILSGIIALLLALFQYKYKRKNQGTIDWILIGIRFLSVFLLCLLLVNPRFEKVVSYEEKPTLVVAVDNSNSVAYLEHDNQVKRLIESIDNNDELKERFHVDWYAFSEDLTELDTLDFKGKQTNLDRVFSDLTQIYRQENAPTILVTDGNQTYGGDYSFTSEKYGQSVYPVILGDSTVYSDLKIQKLNVNKYAFLKNRFPVEAILVYNGEETVSSTFKVTVGNTTVFSKNVTFSPGDNSEVLNFYLSANQVGVFTYHAEIIPLENEKNTVNNTKNFAVEVIDQKTNVALVSAIRHPDLGALKKAIESNEQREATILTPEAYLENIDNYQLVIAYQPNTTFKKVFDSFNDFSRNVFYITGTHTDWNFLNSLDLGFKQTVTNQKEDYLAYLNLGYSNFLIEDIDFESFPPLQSTFGEVDYQIAANPLLFQRIGSVSTETPLLSTFERNQSRYALLMGEGIWKWRAQTYLNSKSFSEFDTFLGKLIQYLASTKKQSRLTVDYESFYEGNNNISLKAQYFNKNYEFDQREPLEVVIKDKNSEQVTTYPLVLKNNFFEVDLSNLPPSDYSFTVKAVDENISTSGSFKILDYNVEQQFLNAEITKLNQVASQSQGKSFFIDDYDQIINDLLEDNRYKPLLKNNRIVVPLIDWKYLLALVVLLLGAEWFIRKYNGLI